MENNKNIEEIIELTRDNLKIIDWSERKKYHYKGLLIELDHEYDAGSYNVWLDLPQGLNYISRENFNGDLPYKNVFFAGYMGDNPNWEKAMLELMDYVDDYYEYLNPANY